MPEQILDIVSLRARGRISFDRKALAVELFSGRRLLVMLPGLGLAAASLAGVPMANSAPVGSPPTFFLPPPGGHNYSAGGGNLTYHGGSVMAGGMASAGQTAKVYVVYWGPAKQQDGASRPFPSGFGTLTSGVFKNASHQSLANVNTQYYWTNPATGLNQFIHSGTALGAIYFDKTPYPNDCSAYYASNCVTQSDLQSRVNADIALKGWKTSINTEVFIFTQPGEAPPGAYTDYCAYHSYTSVGGRSVPWAYIPYPLGKDGSYLCYDPGNGQSSPNNNIPADAAINVQTHELFESITNPNGGGWWDDVGDEIGDKCAWYFGPNNYDGGRANESWNGHFYSVQEEYSNTAGSCVQ